MRKSKIIVSLALAGALITTSMAGYTPKSEAAITAVNVATVLDTSYENWTIQNANGKSEDEHKDKDNPDRITAQGDSRSRMYYQVYLTEDGEKGTKGPGNTILNKLSGTGYTLGDIYGVRFYTNVDTELENLAAFNGVIQFANSGRPMRDKNGNVMYTYSKSEDTYTMNVYQKYINFETGDIIYGNATVGTKPYEGGQLIKTGTGFTVDADGKFVKALSNEELNKAIEGDFDGDGNNYWTTPSFSVKSYPTWTNDDTGETGKYHTLMADDGSVTYKFTSPIGDDTNTNFAATFIVYQCSNQHVGVGVTGIELLGKTGNVIYKDFSLGDLSKVKSVSFEKKNAALGIGENQYIPAKINSQTWQDPYKNNTKPIVADKKYIYSTGCGVEYSATTKSCCL